MSNAIKYTAGSQIIIRIFTLAQKSSVSLVIEDNGIGKEGKDHNRIFYEGFYWLIWNMFF
ncbi:ATP-binding protein [Psychrobacillus sp. OK032]|uniref:ATP-binding protein n=1 Tax=Psychrobacillus sp. OK032 TaxID=1884358 RepID=UPI00350EB47B